MFEFLKEKYLKCGGLRKFIVIKIEDLKHINSVFKLAMLDNDLNDIAAGRQTEGKEPSPEYLVINTDEPYAGDIINLLQNNGHWPGFENLGHRRPEIICLCGSTRFFKTFDEHNFRLTLEGKIVLSVGCNTKSDEGLKLTSEDKVRLDELHKRKIDLCDSVMVLNVDGYIGDSTRSEIEYARRTGKQIAYLEPIPFSAAIDAAME